MDQYFAGSVMEIPAARVQRDGPSRYGTNPQWPSNSDFVRLPFMVAVHSDHILSPVDAIDSDPSIIPEQSISMLSAMLDAVSLIALIFTTGATLPGISSRPLLLSMMVGAEVFCIFAQGEKKMGINRRGELREKTPSTSQKSVPFLCIYRIPGAILEPLRSLINNLVYTDNLLSQIS